MVRPRRPARLHRPLDRQLKRGMMSSTPPRRSGRTVSPRQDSGLSAKATSAGRSAGTKSALDTRSHRTGRQRQLRALLVSLLEPIFEEDAIAARFFAKMKDEADLAILGSFRCRPVLVVRSFPFPAVAPDSGKHSGVSGVPSLPRFPEFPNPRMPTQGQRNSLPGHRPRASRTPGL